MKARKPRVTSKPMEIDDTCHIRGRPYRFDTPAERKIWDRVKNGLCPGCGELKCKCKSKGEGE